MRTISQACVGNKLVAPVCSCGKHFEFRSMDVDGLTAFLCCPDYPAAEHEGWDEDLFLTGEWDNLPDMYVMCHARRYSGIPCILRGHVRDVALQLAKFARSKCKGRMTDSAVRYYATEYEATLRRDALKEETVELQLVAYSSPFEVGTNAGRSQKVDVPATLHDIYKYPVEFEWHDVGYAAQ